MDLIIVLTIITLMAMTVIIMNIMGVWPDAKKTKQLHTVRGVIQSVNKSNNVVYVKKGYVSIPFRAGSAIIDKCKKNEGEIALMKYEIREGSYNIIRDIKV